MTTDTTTLTGCIERVRELLARDEVSRAGDTLHFRERFGPEYDPLRRVVTCTEETACWEWYADRKLAICFRCGLVCGTQKPWHLPFSRATYWQATEERDPGVLAGALAAAVWRTTVLDSDSDSFVGATMVGDAYAVLQAVVAALEAA